MHKGRDMRRSADCKTITMLTTERPYDNQAIRRTRPAPWLRLRVVLMSVKRRFCRRSRAADRRMRPVVHDLKCNRELLFRTAATTGEQTNQDVPKSGSQRVFLPKRYRAAGRYLRSRPTANFSEQQRDVWM